MLSNLLSLTLLVGSWDDVFKVAVILYIIGTVVWNLFSTGEKVLDWEEYSPQKTVGQLKLSELVMMIGDTTLQQREEALIEHEAASMRNIIILNVNQVR